MLASSRDEKNSQAACMRLFCNQNILDPSVAPARQRNTRESSIRGNLQVEINQLPGCSHRSHCLHQQLDAEATDRLLQHLKEDLKENDVIVQFSLGIGSLTQDLLSHTTNRVILYEPNLVMKQSVAEKFFPQYSSRLEIVDLSFEKFIYYFLTDEETPDSNMLGRFLNPLPVRGNEIISLVKVVGVASNLRLVLHLAVTAIYHICLYKDIIPVFYLYVKDSTYKSIVILKKIPWILFLFHFEIIDKGCVTRHHPLKVSSVGIRHVLMKISLNEVIYTKVGIFFM